MQKSEANSDDELLHPLWLGILLLFSVLAILGVLCLLRRKCGTRLAICCNRLLGRDKRNCSNRNKRIESGNFHTWPPLYIPAPIQSPKLYSLIRNIHMVNLDTEHPHPTIQEENEDDIEQEVFFIGKRSIDEPDTNQMVVPRRQSVQAQASTSSRTSEAARKLYASMRNSSQCENSSSIESYSNDIPSSNGIPSPSGSSLVTNQSSKPKRSEKLRLFRTPRFFHSLADTDGVGMAL